jgi:hypothetical protein
MNFSAMNIDANQANTDGDPKEADVFACNVSDAALEAAASTAGGHAGMLLTVVMCTGNLDCPF